MQLEQKPNCPVTLPSMRVLTALPYDKNKQTNKDRNLSLMAWKNMCLPSEGGLGFRSLQDINDALVSKLSWKMLTQKDCLWVKLLNCKYLENCGFWEAESLKEV